MLQILSIATFHVVYFVILRPTSLPFSVCILRVQNTSVTKEVLERCKQSASKARVAALRS
jgi:hypothetical protein